MPNIFQPECGPKCRSKQHTLEVNSVVTKGSLVDLQAYSLLCHTWAQHTDTAGRSALHVATSCGKLDIVEWLVEEKHQDPSLRDKESGWTALHRAMFYGQLAVARLLIQWNADLYCRDHEGLGPLDILVKDRPQHLSFDTKDGNEVYSWGDNSNLTLGHASEQRRTVPDAVDTFRRLGVSIKQIVMCKYHTVFLSHTGQVYTCGHGLGGRLGHGDERTCVMPTLVQALEKEECIQVAAARDHTLFLTENKTVYCCGLNDYHQLGVAATGEKGTSKYLLPTKMNLKAVKGKNILGVCAGRYHSLVYTADSMYTCGFSAGQLGHPKGEKYQSQLRLVTFLSHKDVVITKVATSDAAIVVFTGRGDIFLMHDYTCRKIGSRWLDIDKLLVCGGNLDHNADLDILREKGGFEVKVVLLNNTGKVFMWRSTSPSLKRCHFAVRRQVLVRDIGLNVGGLLLITDQGEAFVGYPSGKKSTNVHKEANKEVEFGKLSLLDLMLKDEMEEISLRRIPGVHRAVTLACDLKGHNFAVTQALPNVWLTDVPCVSESTIHTEYQQLMEEADLFDAIHDCVVQVEDRKWPAHMFILASRADYFRKQVPAVTPESGDHEDKPVMVVSEVQPDVMEQLLKFIYTDTCDLLTVGAKFSFHNVEKKNGHNNNNSATTTKSDEVILDGKTTSAFEAAQRRKKGKGGKEERAEEEKGGGRRLKDPVKILQEAARRFGVKGLSKRLEAVKCVNGVVQSSGKKLQASRVKYDRTKLGELCDVRIQADDGASFQCHKCVLAARLEYFHSMLGSGWMEASDTQSLSLPIPGDILQVLLDYVYQDQSSSVAESQDMELICNVLVVADQLLVSRLKEMCEAALTAQMTLRNVGELLEISTAYNAAQLRQACHQFIFLNLPALLESRNLDLLSEDTMQDLTVSYKQAVSRMSSRVITPWSHGPDQEFLASLTAEFDAKLTPKSRESSTKKVKAKRRQGRTKSASEEAPSGGGVGHQGGQGSLMAERQISVCSDVGTKSEEDVECEVVVQTQAQTQATELQQQQQQQQQPTLVQKVKARRWIPFTPSPGQETSHSKPAHLHTAALQTAAVTPAMGRSVPSPNVPVQHVNGAAQPSHSPSVNGVAVPQQSSLGTPAPAQTAVSASVPKEANSTPSASVSLRNIMQEQQDSAKSGVKPKTGGKFSWKEEKKKLHTKTQVQKAGGDPHQEPTTPTSPTPALSAPAACPWGSVNKVVQSFRDLMLQDTSTKPNQQQQHQQQQQQQRTQQAKPVATPPASAPPRRTSSDLTLSVENQSTAKHGTSHVAKSPPVTGASFSWGLPVRIPSHPQPIPQPSSPSPPPSASSPPDNPWQRTAASSPPGGASAAVSFSDIVQDQMHQKMSLEKASQKPLHLIQIEEEAMSQLLLQYGAHVRTDEHITVERVSGPVAAPLWNRTRNTSTSHT